MDLQSLAVLGTGGVGGCIAAILARKGLSVTCVDREETVEAIARGGLTLESKMFGQFTVHPEAVTRLTTSPNVLFVTTKATHLDQALDRIAPDALGDTVIIPLLNGLEHVQTLRERLGNRVAAGSIRIVSRLKSPASILHTSAFIIIKMASDKDIDHDRLEGIAHNLTDLGIETTVLNSEAAVLWDKLVRLGALACTTSLTNQPIGLLRKDPYWRGILEKFINEAVAVAASEGISIDSAAQMSVIDGLPEGLTSSMQRDIAEGRPSELDAIAGAVVRAGEKNGVKCPTIRDLINKIETQRVDGP